MEGAFKLVRIAWAPCSHFSELLLVKWTGCLEDRSGYLKSDLGTLKMLHMLRCNDLLEVGIISEFWRSLVKNQGGEREPSDTEYQLLKIA